MTVLRAAEAVGPITPETARRQESEARSLTNACQQFMRDEFPKLSPPVRHFFTTRNDDIQPPVWQAAGPGGAADQLLQDAITATAVADATTWADEVAREEVAVALRDRRLTSSRRANKPFVFRSGGPFGSGTKVWTIRDAVRHMDRYPSDGIYHLRNGTLASGWTRRRAPPGQAGRDAVVGPKPTFAPGSRRSCSRPAWLSGRSSGSGPGGRPGLRAGAGIQRPRPSHLQRPWARLSIRRPVHQRPWLNTEPRTIEGGPVEIIVSAETGTLPISAERYAAEVRIDSSASEEPVAVPVRLRVMATPSGMIRKVLRPANGLLIAGILGAALGWLWTRAGIPAPLPVVVAIPFLNSMIFWAS